jgi:hypothetical protein
LKNILENEGIRAFLNNEHFGTLFPFNRPMGQGDVKVIVSDHDAESAKEIVSDFEKDRSA